jgi:hypothetical protein
LFDVRKRNCDVGIFDLCREIGFSREATEGKEESFYCLAVFKEMLRWLVGCYIIYVFICIVYINMVILWILRRVMKLKVKE